MEYQRLDNDMLEGVLDTLVRFGEDQFPRSKRLEMDREEIFPEELIRRMLSPEFALQLVFIPEEYDGLGGGAYDIYRVSEALAKIDLGMATAFLAISLGADPLRVGGTEEQKQRWMGRIANEGLIVAYGVTEPSAGSDLGSFTTRADQVTNEAGEVTGYRLNGVKQFITNGGVADLYTILARTPGGPSFFVLESGVDGLSAGAPEVKHGIRLSNTSQVILEDVEVPADQLIGGVEGQGMAQAVAVFGYTRLMVAAFGLGGGEAALSAAVRYACERKQFGKALLEMQGYTHTLLVPHAVNLEASRAFIEETADRLDGGEEGLETEGAIAKYYATESANNAAEAAIQALGGYGYTHEYEVEKIKRDVRITTIYEGTSEIMLQTIGKDRWRQFLQTRGEFYASRSRDLDEVHTRVPDCGAGSLAKSMRILLSVMEKIRTLRLTRQQVVLFMMAEMIVGVETGRALSLLAARSDENLSADRVDYRKACARVHAANVAALIGQKTRACLAGFGASTVSEIQTMMQSLNLDTLCDSYVGYSQDMNRISELLPMIKCGEEVTFN